MRLVNGEDRCSGTLEVYYANQWGTVCDDGWDIEDSHVVCRQLNCGVALSALSEAYFGTGQGPIMLDSLECTGSETALDQCSHNGLWIHNCQHSEDAGVVCSGKNVCTLTLQIGHYNTLQLSSQLIISYFVTVKYTVWCKSLRPPLDFLF